MRVRWHSEDGKIKDARGILRGLATLAGEGSAFAVAEAVDNPMDQFGKWLEEAIEAGVPEPQAMTLSTVDAQGRLDARVRRPVMTT